MPGCKTSRMGCNTQIDYSKLILGERILPFVFELDLNLSVLDPAEGQNQRFCYRVTGVGENISTYVSLVHWVLSLCPNIRFDQIVNIEVTIGEEKKTVIKGENVNLIIPPDTDPDTGCPGLKFDFPISKVFEGENSTGLFSFELTTPYPVGAANVCVKGGSDVSTSALAICGPVCSDEETCHANASQLVNVCVPITVRPYAYVGPTKTTCGGPLYINSRACRGKPGATCTFYATQQICIAIPINYGASATAGESFVECGMASEGECACHKDDDEDK